MRGGVNCCFKAVLKKGCGLNYLKRQSDARLAVTGASSRLGAVMGRGAAARGDFGRAAPRRAAGPHDDIMPSAVGAELKTGASDTASRTFVDDF